MAKFWNKNIQIPEDPPATPALPVVVLMLVLFWPVGLFLGFKRIANEATRKRLQRFRRYASVIGNRNRISLRELAATLDMPVENLAGEIQSMIDRGMIRGNAYIDRSHMTLHMDDDVVETEFVSPVVNVFVSPESRAQTVAEAEAKSAARGRGAAAPKTETAPKAAQPEARKAPEPKKSAADSDNFEAKLREIRQINDDIADKAVSERIDRIGELTASIFRVVREKPEHAEDVRKFMNYYLPTTLKLLKSYSLMEKQSYQGENIQASRKKIEDVLDTLVRAFEQQQDRLFRTEAMDVEADISVLETMMASDGLIREEGGLRVGGR